MKTYGYLLDTNICAFYLRGKYHVDKSIDHVGWNNCYISEITMLDLRYGVELSMQRDGVDRTQQLERFLEAVNILPIADAIPLAAKEKIRLRLLGTPAADDFDLLIGCTAITYNFIMVTDNTKDFKNFQNIRLENWIER